MSNWRSHIFTVIAVVLTLLVYYVWLNVENRWALMVTAAVYLALTGALYYGQKREAARQGIGLLLFSLIASLAFLSVVENVAVKSILLVIGLVILAHFFFYPGEANLPPPQKKPWRRWRTFIIVWDFLAVAVLLFALNAFLPQFPFWLLAAGGSAVGAYLTSLLWQEYLGGPRRKFLLWTIIFCLLLWESLWVIQLLPLGYLASGVLVVWPWYVAELLVRFHLSPEGIIWRHQLTFLAVNLVLYVGILGFFVKWI